MINILRFYKNDRSKKCRWLTVGALLEEESAIRNLKIMKTSIAQILRLSPQQEEELQRADFQAEPSAAFFLYASYSLRGDIAAADAMLRLIQDREIEISALLLNGISKVNNDDIQDR